MNFKAVIPARGGSKGIKKKNLINFNGKPLIYWTVEHARESKNIDDFFISSEDDEILSYAKKLGVKTHERSRKLSSDSSTTLDLLINLNSNPEFKSDNYVILQPTSPLRQKKIIDKCVDEFIDKKYDCLATGFICKNYEWGKTKNTGRQKLKGWFYDDGNIYILSNKLIDLGKWYSKNSGKYLQAFPWTNEIDTYSDLKIMEYIAKNLKDFL